MIEPVISAHYSVRLGCMGYRPLKSVRTGSMYSLYLSVQLHGKFTDADVKNKSGLNNLTDYAGKHAVKSCRNRNKIQFFTWILGGRPFDSEGGGGAGKGRDILFIFSVSSTGKLIFKNIKARIFIFIRNNFLKKQKKSGGGGGVGMLV